MTKNQAIEFVSSLSKGIDPQTGKVLFGDTIINRPDIIRSFFDLLELLKCGNDNPLSPFALSSKDGIKCELCGITEFVRRVNEKREEGTQQLKVSRVVNWFVENEYLIIETQGEKNIKLPSQKGIESGISFSEENRYGRTYIKLYYNNKIQNILLDNLINGNIK